MMITCDRQVVLPPGTTLRVAKINSRRVVTVPGFVMDAYAPPPMSVICIYAVPGVYNTRSHLEMLAYDRAAHLPGRHMSLLEADEVEVEPIVELAPMLAAVNAAPETQQRAPQPHHPTRPGRPSDDLARVWRLQAHKPHAMTCCARSCYATVPVTVTAIERHCGKLGVHVEVQKKVARSSGEARGGQRNRRRGAG